MVWVFVSASEVSGGRLLLTGDAARHVGGALRVRPGEELVAVSHDAVEHLCRVVSASPREVVAEVVASSPSRMEPRRHVRVCQALLKGDQFERVLEFGTELGVSSFQPLLTERVVARPPDERLLQRAERWRLVCRQGAELAHRGRLPEVLEPASLGAAATRAVGDGLDLYMLYEGQGLPGLGDVIATDGGCCLLVGPEGGWSEAEVMLARESGARPVSLGPRIMRPLPAVLAAVAIALDRSDDLELPAADGSNGT
ncbi:MAG: rRNA (uracil1498-N3)-methyltransferase [Chloroflexota bacterium]|nr:rRNA (uracil1498-N3)-methyltransferase [Chloroflexota bacterium]